MKYLAIQCQADWSVHKRNTTIIPQQNWDSDSTNSTDRHFHKHNHRAHGNRNMNYSNTRVQNWQSSVLFSIDDPYIRPIHPYSHWWPICVSPNEPQISYGQRYFVQNNFCHNWKIEAILISIILCLANNYISHHFLVIYLLWHNRA